MVVPFSIDEPTKASWYISVTTDSNGICTVTAILPPLRSHRLATGYVAERRAARCDHGQVASPIGQEQDRHPSQEGRTASCLILQRTFQPYAVRRCPDDADPFSRGDILQSASGAEGSL